jgi:hypothetical protein
MDRAATHEWGHLTIQASMRAISDIARRISHDDTADAIQQSPLVRIREI